MFKQFVFVMALSAFGYLLVVSHQEQAEKHAAQLEKYGVSAEAAPFVDQCAGALKENGASIKRSSTRFPQLAKGVHEPRAACACLAGHTPSLSDPEFHGAALTFVSSIAKAHSGVRSTATQSASAIREWKDVMANHPKGVAELGRALGVCSRAETHLSDKEIRRLQWAMDRQ